MDRGGLVSTVSTQTFRWTLAASVDRGTEIKRTKECLFSGVTSFGSLEDGAGKEGSECELVRTSLSKSCSSA